MRIPDIAVEAKNLSTITGWSIHSSTLVAFYVAFGVSLLGALVKLVIYATRVAFKRASFNYVTFRHDLKDVLVTDCTHPHARTLTHHKGQRNPAGLGKSDTSTGLVLNAIKVTAWDAGQTYEWCQIPQVSTNHFDVDSFLAVWSYINRQLALQHEAVLRHMARIGDFREAFLSPELVVAHGAEDGIGNIRDAYTALKLVCWINSVERTRFSAPYEDRDCDAKFAFFLPRFAAVLANPESVWQEWQDEYREVVSGFDVLRNELPYMERHPGAGLVVLRPPEPTLHYYSLFSHTVGYDTVLTMYENQRYELEAKYTQFVTCHSRPVWPRVDFGALARVLNRMEGNALGPQLRWTAPRFTDTGPVLRIEDTARPLSKAQRYGHPYARMLYSSTIAPDTMAALVTSYLEYGMQGLKPKRGGWSWDELQSLNAGTAWQLWEDTALQQWERGELQPDAPFALAPFASGGTPCTTELGSWPTHPGGADSRPGSFSGGGTAPYPRVGVAMTPGGGFWEPSLSEPSALMPLDDVRALASAVPARLAPGRWQLLYGSARDGISLRTLYRKAAGRAPTLLVVREAGPSGHVFGAFALEAWRPGPRFYGTGETFVFTLQPQRVKYGWQRPRQSPAGGAGCFGRASSGSGGGATAPYVAAAAAVPSTVVALPHTGLAAQLTSSQSAPVGGGALPATAAAAAAAAGAPGNLDFFQFSTHEGLGVGGLGSFAFWLDNELLEGASYSCDTFGSPQLSCKEEFKVAGVELWQL